MSLWNELRVIGHRPSQRGGHASALISLTTTTSALGKEEEDGENSALMGRQSGSPYPPPSTGIVVIGGADSFGTAYNEVLLFEPIFSSSPSASASAVRRPSSSAGSTACSSSNNNDNDSCSTMASRSVVAMSCHEVRCTVLQSQSSSCAFAPRMGHSAHTVEDEDLAKRMADAAPQFPSGAVVEEIDGSADTAASSATTAARFSNPIVVFGGMTTAPDEAVHNSVWLLYVDLDFAKKIEADAAKKVRTSSTPLVKWVPLGGCSGDLPPPRHSHASSLVGDELLVVGGSDGNQPLEDAYSLNLVTRVWRRIELKKVASSGNTHGKGDKTNSEKTHTNTTTSLTTSTSAAYSSASSPFAAREMASMCVHPCVSEGRVALLTGGRDNDGLMLGDAVAFSSSAKRDVSTSSSSSSSLAQKSISPRICGVYDDPSRFRRCCHTLVPSMHNKLGPVFVCVGGFTPEGMPPDDLLVSLIVNDGDAADADRGDTNGIVKARMTPITVPRKLSSKPGGELHFGLGHSAASTVPSRACAASPLPRTFVVSGIIPNTIGATMSVYEMVMDTSLSSLRDKEGQTIGAHVGKGVEQTGSSPKANGVAGLI